MKLKKCPFCGGEADTLELHFDTEDGYMCGNVSCPISGEVMPLRQWNTRKADKEYDGLIERIGELGIERDVAFGELSLLKNSHKALLDALKDMVDCSPCQNGCAKDDMSCATRKAEKAIAESGE